MKKKQSKKPSRRRMSRVELAKRFTALQSSSSPSGRGKVERDAELRAVFHELEVSQLELEVQNRELVESRQAVDVSHDRYMNLYDFAPVGYMTIDKKGIIREINLTAAEFLGVERQRLIGHSFAHRVLKSDVQLFRTHIMNCRDADKKVTSVVHLLGAQAVVIPVQLLSACSRDRVTGEMLFRTAITDLTEQRRIEQERQELLKHVEAARKELFDFFMQAPAPMAVLTGPDHVFTLANEPYVRLVGQQVLGSTIRAVFSQSEQRFYVEIFDRVYQTGQPYVGKEIHFSKPDVYGKSRNFFLNVSYTPFRSNEGKIKGVLVFEQDVTDQVLARKRLEAEKERERYTQDMLRSAKAGAERANESKSAFLANMSHEIRTPLGAILGFTELIRDSTSESERIEYSRIVSRNGHILTRLIDDILDLSKVEAGRIELERIDFNTRDLVDDVVGLLQESAKSKKIELNTVVDSATPDYMKSDPTRIRQILVNIIGNAIKFTTHGTIDLSVKVVPTENESTRLEFVVKDTGIGMTNEQASKLFEPFSQADNSTTRRFGGSGLGLALSRRLARALGGDVEIQGCAPGQGCTFVAYIEAWPAVRTNEIQKVAEEPTTALLAKGPHHKKVLLVEDSLDNQKLVTRILSKAGMIVDIAQNGAEGVEMAEANDYDVVLMDMQMPVLDGYAATEQLRFDGYLKPIVALTAHAMVEDRIRILQLGCDAYLTKPLDSKLLVETIDRFQT